MASCPEDCTVANPQHAVASEGVYVLEDKLRPTYTVVSIHVHASHSI